MGGSAGNGRLPSPLSKFGKTETLVIPLLRPKPNKNVTSRHMIYRKKGKTGFVTAFHAFLENPVSIKPYWKTLPLTLIGCE